jgi:hypothetical protein
MNNKIDFERAMINSSGGDSEIIIDLLYQMYENLAGVVNLSNVVRQLSDPYPDTNADGFTFCGKCGKMR